MTWSGFACLEVNIWLQTDHIDCDPLQHVVGDLMNIFICLQSRLMLFHFSLFSSLFTNYTHLVKCF